MNELARVLVVVAARSGLAPRSVEASQALLDEVGLAGDFWALR